MLQISVSVDAETDGLAEIITAELFTELKGNPEIDVAWATPGAPEVAPDSSVRARSADLYDVAISFIGSAAALALAQALRDFVRRQRTTVRIRLKNGSTLHLESVGQDTQAVADIVGFITQQHVKIVQRNEAKNDNPAAASVKDGHEPLPPSDSASAD